MGGTRVVGGIPPVGGPTGTVPAVGGRTGIVGGIVLPAGVTPVDGGVVGGRPLSTESPGLTGSMVGPLQSGRPRS